MGNYLSLLSPNNQGNQEKQATQQNKTKEEIQNEFNQNGYILLKNFFSEEEAEQITEIANELENWNEEPFKWMIYFENKLNNDNSKFKSRIENFLNYHPLLQKIFKEKINSLVNEVTLKDLVLFKEKMNWKNPKGKGFKPHQDQPAWTDFKPSKYYTLALFANNTTIENGCLEFGTQKNKERINTLLDYEKNGTGELTEEVVSQLDWKYVETTPRDVLIFDSYIPHRSGDNTTDNSRRIFYFTFNDREEGEYYDAYLVKKREEFPPDIERVYMKEVSLLGNKYNLANPIE